MNRAFIAIGATYFFITGSPGFWTPVLSKVLEGNGWSQWLVLAFMIKPIASFVAPLAISAQADQRIPAEKIVAVLLTVGAILQVLAFRELQLGESAVRFLCLFTIQSLITAPTFALLNTITFAYLDGRVSRYGVLRVWGTIGWIAAGWIVSLLRLDASPVVGYLAASSTFAAVGCCLFLPKTKPQAKPSRRLVERLGLTSMKFLRTRDIGVVVIVSCLFMMPLTAFYMHTPLFVNHLGTERIAATMSVGQLTEVAALIGMGFLMRRFDLRVLMMAGFGFAIARFALFAFADADSFWKVVLGIALHGLCWSFFFEIGRAFLDHRAPVEYRAQIQALVTLGTNGLGSIIGTALVGLAYSRMVPTPAGWPDYWWLLTGWCALCGLGFWLTFRDESIETDSLETASLRPRPRANRVANK